MNDFIHGKKRLRFWTVTGEVIGSSKHSETQVYGDGGGGYLHQGSGFISGGNFSSSSITCHEFWLHLDDGTEMPVSLTGVDIPLRPGQRITLISAGLADSDGGRYCTLVNHAANRYWSICNAATLNEGFGIEVAKLRTLGLIVIYNIVAFFGLAGLTYLLTQAGVPESFIMNDIVLGVWLSSIPLYFIYRYFRRKVRTSRLVNRLDTHLHSLARAAFQTS